MKEGSVESSSSSSPIDRPLRHLPLGHCRRARTVSIGRSLWGTNRGQRLAIAGFFLFRRSCSLLSNCILVSGVIIGAPRSTTIPTSCGRAKMTWMTRTTMAEYKFILRFRLALVFVREARSAHEALASAIHAARKATPGLCSRMLRPISSACPTWPAWSDAAARTGAS